MAAPFGGITQSNVFTSAQSRLMSLRLALEAGEDYYQWLSAYAAADLQGAPLSIAAADATALLTAFADAHGMYVAFNGGVPVALTASGSVITPYNFSASMRKIIGPQF
jgi:hypothetical protein